MGYPPIEELLPKTGGSVYRLVRLAADRAVELADGKVSLISHSPTEKTVTIALEEIRQGKVVLKAMADRFSPPEKPSSQKASAEDEPTKE